MFAIIPNNPLTNVINYVHTVRTLYGSGVVGFPLSSLKDISQWILQFCLYEIYLTRRPNRFKAKRVNLTVSIWKTFNLERFVEIYTSSSAYPSSTGGIFASTWRLLFRATRQLRKIPAFIWDKLGSLPREDATSRDISHGKRGARERGISVAFDSARSVRKTYYESRVFYLHFSPGPSKGRSCAPVSTQI